MSTIHTVAQLTSGVGCGGIVLVAGLLLAVVLELVAVILALIAWMRRRPGLGRVANWMALAGTPPLLFILPNAAVELTGPSGLDWEVFGSFTLAVSALLMGTRALSFRPTAEPQRRRWRMIAVALGAMWLFFVVFLVLGAYRGKQHERELRQQLYRDHGIKLAR